VALRFVTNPSRSLSFALESRSLQACALSLAGGNKSKSSSLCRRRARTHSLSHTQTAFPEAKPAVETQSRLAGWPTAFKDK
jgi:hypothetical protein